MASRRKLKKTIRLVSSQLITDTYFRCLMSKNVDEQEVDKIVIEIMDINREFILRINHEDGKNNPVIVRTYYQKLFSDWQKAIGKVMKEIETL